MLECPILLDFRRLTPIEVVLKYRIFGDPGDISGYLLLTSPYKIKEKNVIINKRKKII